MENFECFEQLGIPIKNLYDEKIHHYTGLYEGQEIYIEDGFIGGKNKAVKAKVSAVGQGGALAKAGGFVFMLNYISGEWRHTGRYHEMSMKNVNL